MVRRGGSRGRASGRGGDGTRAGRTVRATRRRSRSESPGVCPGASAWWTLLVFALSSLSSRRPLFFFFLPGAAGDPSGPGLAFRFPGPSPPRVGLDRKKMTPPSFARVDPGREKRPFRCSESAGRKIQHPKRGFVDRTLAASSSGERAAEEESPPAAFTGCHFRLSPGTGGLVLRSQCPSSKFFSSSSSVRVGGCWVSAIQRRFKTEGVDPTRPTGQQPRQLLEFGGNRAE